MLVPGAPAGRIEVRGEVFLPRASFERTNREREETGEPIFANPRNAAAGTMRNLDPALVAKRGLSSYTYQVLGGPPKGGRYELHSQMLTAMREWGLPVESHWRTCLGVDALNAFCQEWAEKRRSLQFGVSVAP